jgi:hypothetical protein
MPELPPLGCPATGGLHVWRQRWTSGGGPVPSGYFCERCLSELTSNKAIKDWRDLFIPEVARQLQRDQDSRGRVENRRRTYPLLDPRTLNQWESRK